MRRLLAMAVAAALIGGAAHARSPKLPKPPADAPAETFLAWHQQQKRVVTTASGLQYQVLTKGQKGAASPTDTDIVTISYSGTLTNGAPFDANPRAEFGVNQVVAGFSEALKLMTKGAKFRVWIPPQLGYGAASPTPAIPPNSVLVFEITLLDVRNSASAEPQG